MYALGLTSISNTLTCIEIELNVKQYTRIPDTEYPWQYRSITSRAKTVVAMMRTQPQVAWQDSWRQPGDKPRACQLYSDTSCSLLPPHSWSLQRVIHHGERIANYVQIAV